MPHAFLILAHDKPEALVRLLQRLDHPQAKTFVHLDRKCASRFDFSELRGLGARVISTQRVNWGGLSSCLAQLDLLRVAQAEGPFATYTLLSGSDYPVMLTNQIVTELDGLRGSLIETAGVAIAGLGADRPWLHERYHRRFYYDSPGSRWLNAVSARLQPFTPKRVPPRGITVHFGGAWWTLNGHGVESLFRFCEERPDVVRWFRHVRIADEAFFQTALVNSTERPELDERVRRYIRWDAPTPHPKNIELSDLDEAMSGDYWFARKIDDRRYPGVTDAIDQRLASGPPQTATEVGQS